MSTRLRWPPLLAAMAGSVLVLILHWLVFFYVPTEASQGLIQRIFYVHVPAAWVAFVAFGVVALCSAVYLWLGDQRLDMAAVSAAEAGMVFTTIVLLTGPLWGRVAWGTWWTREPRLNLTLLHASTRDAAHPHGGPGGVHLALSRGGHVSLWAGAHSCGGGPAG